MAKKTLTPEQAEIKALKKARKSMNLTSFIAVLLAVVLTVGVVVIADKTSVPVADNSDNKVENSSGTQIEDENTTENMDSDMIIGDNGTITIVGVNDDSTSKEEQGDSKKELSANPAEWSKEDIVAVYKNSAAKSHKVVESSQVYAMPKLIVNDGDGALGFFLKMITPVIASVLEKNAMSYEGITGGYTKMVPSDVQSAKAYKDGDYIVIKFADMGRVVGLEYHKIFDWDTKEFIDISEDAIRFDDLGFGFSIYKHMGIDFYIGV